MKRLLALVVLVALVPLASALVASASQLIVRPASLTGTLVAPVSVPLVLALTNGGTIAGRAETGDRVTVTFRRPLDASTLCSTWPAAPTTTQTISANNAVIVTLADGGTGSDSLSVSTPGHCGGAFGFGSIDLGSPGFTTGGPLTFAGSGTGGRSTISYDPLTYQLVVTLGTRTGAGSAATVGTVTAVYSPPATLKHTDGTTVAPATATASGVAL